MKFYKDPVGERRTELKEFWENQNTPVKNTGKENDKDQYSLIGRLALVYGIFVACMCFIPNPIEGRFIFLLCGSMLIFLGYLLYRKGKSSTLPQLKGNIS
jgi:hypothetical protein